MMMRLSFNERGIVVPAFILTLFGLIGINETFAQVKVDPAEFKGKGVDISSLTFDSSSGESVERVLLYNVGKDMFLNAGGYWGTRTTTFTVGLPLMLIKNSNGTYQIRGPFDNEGGNGQGNLLGVVEDVAGKRGVYYDRDNTYGVNWTFEKDNKNSTKDDIVYNIKSYKKNNSKNNNDYTLYSNEKMDIGVFTSGNYNLVRVLSATDLSKTPKDDKYGQWKIVTVDQVVGDFNTTYETVNPSDATFLMRAQSFNRQNMYNDNEPKDQPLGWHRDGTFDYTTGFTGELDGYADGDDQKYGMFYCGGIRNGKKDAKLYQTVEITASGWYRVDCEAMFYNEDKPDEAIARMFAHIVGEENSPNSVGNAYVDLLPVSYVPKYNGVELSEDKFINNDGVVSNKLEASIMFYNQLYPNRLLVYISVPEGKTKTLKLGIEITEDMDKNDYAFFDDFQLKYLGESFALDEGVTDFHGMGDDDREYKNRVLIFKRTFASDQWNSICLPVNLTREQLNTAFFPNPLLAKLRNSGQPGVIEFETVDFSLYGNEDVVLHAGQCYLIRPGYGGRTDEGVIEIGDVSKTKIKAPYYTLDRVSLTKNKVETELGIADVAKLQDKKDLDGNETDFFTIPGNGYENCKLRVYGTFQKLKKDAAAGTDNRVPATSYTFVEGKLYHLPNAYSQKGFSCWIEDEHQVENPAEARHSLSFSTYINGINDNTTSIEGFVADERDFCPNAVYNIQGQAVRLGTSSIEGLPAGVYIVDGKKVAVK